MHLSKICRYYNVFIFAEKVIVLNNKSLVLHFVCFLPEIQRNLV